MNGMRAENALHERDHRGGDHPIPLSPLSPKVLQRRAGGGRGVALMQGVSAYSGGLRAPFSFPGLLDIFSVSSIPQYGILSSILRVEK